MLSFLWLVILLPLLGFCVLLPFGKRLGEPVAGWIGTAAISGSFISALIVFIGLFRMSGERQWSLTFFEWISAGHLSVNIGFLVDPLSMSMVLFITGIGALIHVYSIGYMHGDSRYPRFFAYLSLFIFSMLVLVLGDNLVLTFLGWEGVGACSYLLISFWFEKDANAVAGKKAFVTNRIGDWGFMIAMSTIFLATGSLRYETIFHQAGGIAQSTATFIAVMLFVAAIGKSAQIPLFVWLPDAMAGPTPVSALIHAATMVTSGVYLLTRLNGILEVASPWVSTLVAFIGVCTALLAATIAVAQTDIKKVLAYSTISQLGFMFLAVGSGAYVAAVFHMITHAFFKALLFLGSGSVIHGMSDEQDMRLMGGLRKYMPFTFATFAIGWLAISGVPPFAGFWSKDQILEFAWHKSPVLFAFAALAALLTAYYMSRQMFMVFFGSPRWGEHAERVPALVTGDEGADEEGTVLVTTGDEVPASPVLDPHFHPHESSWLMVFPLVVLAGLAVLGGLLNLPFTKDSEFLHSWLHHVVTPGQSHWEPSNLLKLNLGLLSALIAAAGIGFAALVYGQKRIAASRVEPAFFRDGWKIDQTISAFVSGPGRKLFDAVALFDRRVIDGAVNGVGSIVMTTSERIRGLQSGLVRRYGLLLFGGVVFLVLFVLTRVMG